MFEEPAVVLRPVVFFLLRVPPVLQFLAVSWPLQLS